MGQTSSITPAATARETIGLAGLGLMGSAIAEMLSVSGYSVLGFDILDSRMQEASAAGVLTAEGPAEIARRCRRIIFSLYDSAAAEAVLGEMLPHLRPGQIIIDTTTGDAESAVKAASAVAEAGGAFLDATISGNRDQLLQHEVTVMAGGTAEAFAECADLFRCFSRQFLHVGGPGTGAMMKLVTNLALGLHRAVLAEALVFAEKLGIEPAMALEVLRSSPAASRIMEAKGMKMVTADYAPVARLSQHLKDVRLILAAGREKGLELPLSRVHESMLEHCESMGLGALDNAAIIEALRENSGSFQCTDCRDETCGPG